MVGARVAITPPLRCAAPGAQGRSAPVNLREGRGQSSVVSGVEVPAVTERPPAEGGRPVRVPARGLRRQQVIPDEIVVQLRVLVVPVAVLVVLHPGDGHGGGLGRRVPTPKAGVRRRDRDGDGLTCPAAPFSAKGAVGSRGDSRCEGLQQAPRVRVGHHLGPLPATFIVPPLRFSNAARFDGDNRRLCVQLFVFAFEPFRAASLLPSHGGLQVNHFEFLLRQSLLEPPQVGFTFLQLTLDVLHGVQVHLGHISIGKLLPPVLGELVLFPHIDVDSRGDQRQKCWVSNLVRQ